MDEARRADHALCERLAAAVAADARVVVQVGRGPGWIGPRLHASRAGCVVHRVEWPGHAGGAEAGAGEAPGPATVTAVDVEREALPFEPGTVDAIVYADSLPRLRDPLGAVRRHRGVLRASGTVVCSLPNLQHHGTVTQLLRGDFHYAPRGVLDPSFVHLFTAAGAVQLLLDAGFVPDVSDRIEDTAPGPGAAVSAGAAVAAGAPLFELLGVGTTDAERDLATRWLVLTGLLQEPVDLAEEIPLTVVACVNDDAQLHANLLRSPWLVPGGPHEVLLFRDRTSAAEGLNAGIEQARNDLVVLVHQDVYLPDGWPARLARQWRLAGAQGGPVGIAGVFGVQSRRTPFDATGHVVHRDRRLHHKVLPCDVDGLDELLMVVPRDTPLRADPELGWHLYGTDLALQAQGRGLRAVVLDAPCHHNSLTGRVPWQYRQSERVMARKWRTMLPIHTNLSSIDTWLLDRSPPGTGPEGTAAADGAGAAPAVAELVARLRREQAALHTELEQARLQVASMQASPFWRARQLYARCRDLLVRRR